MQKIFIKEVNPSTAENKPTIIVDDTGAKMSGFDFALKDLNPGDVIEAELQVKGKYTNIISFNMLEKNTEPPQKEMTTDMWAEKDKVTRASIERQTAAKIAFEHTEFDVSKTLWIAEQIYQWISGSSSSKPTESTTSPTKREANGELRDTVKDAPHVGDKEETAPHNIQAFFNYLNKQGKAYTPSWFKETFGFTDADLQTEEGIAKALEAVKNVEW